MNGNAVLLLLLLFTVGRARRMTRLNFAQLRTLAFEAGFIGSAADTAAAVALAESGGDPAAEGDLALGVSRGLWQINMRAHPEFDGVRLFEQDYNAKAAFLVSSHGTNWNPWTTFRNGAYRKYLPAAGSNA